jgi:hypothetical protein
VEATTALPPGTLAGRVHARTRYAAGTPTASLHPDVDGGPGCARLSSSRLPRSRTRSATALSSNIEFTVAEIFGGGSGEVIVHGYREFAVTVDNTSKSVPRQGASGRAPERRPRAGGAGTRAGAPPRPGAGGGPGAVPARHDGAGGRVPSAGGTGSCAARDGASPGVGGACLGLDLLFAVVVTELPGCLRQVGADPALLIVQPQDRHDGQRLIHTGIAWAGVRLRRAPAPGRSGHARA